MANDKFFINQPDYITHSPTAEPSVSYEGVSRENTVYEQAAQAGQAQAAPVQPALRQTPQVGTAQNTQTSQGMPYGPPTNRSQQPRVSYAQGNSANGQQNYAEELPEDYFVGRSYSFGDKPMQKEETSAAGVIKVIGMIVFVLFFLGVASRVLSGFGEVSNNFSPFFDDGGFSGGTVYFDEDDFPEGVELPEGAVILENGTLPEGVEYVDEYSDDEGFDEDLDEDPFGGEF
jgi:hypothetical protein